MMQNDRLSAPVAFADAVLRGIGQVMLQNNPYTGLFFLAGVAYSSLAAAGAMLAGTVASTAAALLLGADRAAVRDGLFGFNGALVAVALHLFLAPSAVMGAAVVLAAALSTVAMAALMRTMKTWNLPALTAPFVGVTLAWVLASSRLGFLPLTDVLPAARLPQPMPVGGPVTLATVFEGTMAGVAQVFLQAPAVTGALFIVGLLIASRTAAAAALLGSLGGLLVAWGLGAAEPSLREGLFGFNAALTAVALVGVVGVRTGAALVYVALAVVAAAAGFAAMASALEPLGVPALTAPFVLVVWLFLLARPLFGRLTPSSTQTDA